MSQRHSTRPPFPSFPHLTLSREDILERIDAGARNRLGMGGEEMLRAYRAGTLEGGHDAGGVGIIDLLALADLLAKDDPVWDVS